MHIYFPKTALAAPRSWLHDAVLYAHDNIKCCAPYETEYPKLVLTVPGRMVRKSMLVGWPVDSWLEYHSSCRAMRAHLEAVYGRYPGAAI